MTTTGCESNQGDFVPMDTHIRVDQFDEIERRVSDDADRYTVIRRLLDLGIARAREIEQNEQDNKKPASEI